MRFHCTACRRKGATYSGAEGSATCGPPHFGLHPGLVTAVSNSPMAKLNEMVRGLATPGQVINADRMDKFTLRHEFLRLGHKLYGIY